MTQQCYILAELSNEDIVWLMDVGAKTSIPSGTSIITEGMQTDAFYIVIDGRFDIQISALNNQTVAHAGPAEVLGEMSFVDNRPPSATVVANGDATALVIPREALHEKIDIDDAFAKRFYRALSIFMADRLRETLNPGAKSEANVDNGRIEKILGYLRAM